MVCKIKFNIVINVGEGRACTIEQCESRPLSPRPGYQIKFTDEVLPCHHVDDGLKNASDIILGTFLPLPPPDFEEKIQREWEVKDFVPSHPSTDHVELITWMAPPSRFDITYESFWGAPLAASSSTDDDYWRNVDLAADDN